MVPGSDSTSTRGLYIVHCISDWNPLGQADDAPDMSESTRNSDSALLGAGASTSSKSGDSSEASAGNPWRQEAPIPVPKFGSTFTLNNLTAFGNPFGAT